jgi:hypothetical protein
LLNKYISLSIKPIIHCRVLFNQPNETLKPKLPRQYIFGTFYLMQTIMYHSASWFVEKACFIPCNSQKSLNYLDSDAILVPWITIAIRDHRLWASITRLFRSIISKIRKGSSILYFSWELFIYLGTLLI